MEGGMRPNFPPRFEGPNDFYRGPPGPMGPPGIFDESLHPRHRRHDDRRRNRPDFDDESERPERRSRWSNQSPQSSEPLEQNMNGSKESDGECLLENRPVKNQVEEVVEDEGNTTPLRDEPQDPPVVVIEDETIVIEDEQQPIAETNEAVVSVESEAPEAPK